MNKLPISLGVLLLMQLLLIGWLNSPATSEDVSEPEPLLAFDPQRVDQIELRDDSGRVATLVRTDGRWQLPDYHQLAVPEGEVTRLLDSLSAIKLHWPVAESVSAQQRFEVSDAQYQRRLALKAGEQVLATLYLGTSPGYRQVHLRRAGDEAIYAVGLNSYDLPAEPERWFDKRLLQAKGLNRITGDGFQLTLKESQWHAGDGLTVAQEAAEKLADQLRTLTVEAAEPAKPEMQSRLQLSLQDGDQTRTLRFYVEDGEHWVEPEGQRLRYKIPAYRFNALTGASSETLVKSASEDTAAAQAKTANESKPLAAS